MAARAYRTPDEKKEEFRKYLEKSGTVDALTKVLVGLYEEPERPVNAVDYVRKFMGETAGDDSAQLRAENDQLREENARLKGEAERMRIELDRLRAAGDGGGM